MTTYRAAVIVRCGLMGAVAWWMAALPGVGGWGWLVAVLCWAVGLWLWWSPGAHQ